MSGKPPKRRTNEIFMELIVVLVAKIHLKHEYASANFLSIFKKQYFIVSDFFSSKNSYVDLKLQQKHETK